MITDSKQTANRFSSYLVWPEIALYKMAIEGGNYKCPTTGYETPNPLEWNKHAEQCGKHTESGSTVCINCGADIEYKHIPFKPCLPDGSKNIRLQCENCMQDMMGLTKTTSTKKGEIKK